VAFITVSLDQDEEQLRAVLKAQGLKFPVPGDCLKPEFRPTQNPETP
jgi:hypothetical protein